MSFYELEESDETEVREKILEQLHGYDFEDLPEEVTITMICYMTDYDVDFDVRPLDFFTAKELKELL